jgi:hypothetical protein
MLKAKRKKHEDRFGPTVFEVRFHGVVVEGDEPTFLFKPAAFEFKAETCLAVRIGRQ